MMPEPTVDQVAPGGTIDLSKAPAGLDDATFDSLFPADGVSTVVQPVQQANQGTNQNQPQVQTQTQPAQQTQSEYFLKGNKSVYKTPEAAVEGINNKDAIIEQLRQRYALTTGIDPLTGQPVGPSSGPVASDDYAQNPNKYLDDLYAAAKKGEPQAYTQVQQKLIMDTLKPFAPVLGNMAKAQAVETIGKENPEAAKFVASPDFQKTMEANPDLASAVATAESDSRFYSRLPGLYKLAYLAGQGMQLPALLKAQTPQTQSQTQPVRTTAQPTTLNPSTEAAKQPSFKNLDGIRATIKDLEARGARLDF
jgi:hypothetical protein